jgi:hypothetical protein
MKIQRLRADSMSRSGNTPDPSIRLPEAPIVRYRGIILRIGTAGPIINHCLYAEFLFDPRLVPASFLLPQRHGVLPRRSQCR